MISIIDVQQGSPEWFAARAGLPTASEFGTVMSEGRADGVLPNAMLDALVKSGASASTIAAAVKAAKSRNSNPAASRLKYLRQLAGEILTGEPAPEGYSNDFMARGQELEDEARRMFAFMRDVDPQRVGFIRNDRMGCSPDSLIGDDSGLEIKVAIPAVQIERLQRGDLPPEHKAQVQGSMLVTGRPSWNFVSYCPKLPPVILTVERDDEYLAAITKAIEAFNEELDALVASIRGVGQFRAAAA